MVESQSWGEPLFPLSLSRLASEAEGVTGLAEAIRIDVALAKEPPSVRRQEIRLALEGRVSERLFVALNRYRAYYGSARLREEQDRGVSGEQVWLCHLQWREFLDIASELDTVTPRDVLIGESDYVQNLLRTRTLGEFERLRGGVALRNLAMATRTREQVGAHLCALELGIIHGWKMRDLAALVAAGQDSVAEIGKVEELYAAATEATMALTREYLSGERTMVTTGEVRDRIEVERLIRNTTHR